jgi:GGDEF domain-containing protein
MFISKRIILGIGSWNYVNRDISLVLNAQNLVKHTDMAMYKAKQKGKNTYHVYVQSVGSLSYSFSK